MEQGPTSTSTLAAAHRKAAHPSGSARRPASGRQEMQLVRAPVVQNSRPTARQPRPYMYGGRAAVAEARPALAAADYGPTFGVS
eukprot:scaffold1380_cov374-Prasinococcus_capsulatus_cf.AAC.7